MGDSHVSFFVLGNLGSDRQPTPKKKPQQTTGEENQRKIKTGRAEERRRRETSVGGFEEGTSLQIYKYTDRQDDM